MPYNLSPNFKTGRGLAFFKNIFKSLSNPCWLPILFSLTYVSVTQLLCLGSTLSQYTSNYLGHPCNNAGAVADVFQSFGIFSVSQDWLEINKGIVPGISNPWGLTDLFLVSLYIYTENGKHPTTSIIYLIPQNRFFFYF